jgi:hypothetical protein
MTKGRKVSIPQSLLIPVVGDGAIAGSIADGRLIPVLILDVAARKDLPELIRLHAHLSPGDAESQWATSRENADHVMLLVKFLAPMELEMAILFGIERQAILVDMILSSGAVYLQAGSPGDRVSVHPDAPKVLVEVPDTGFGPIWDELLDKRMTVVMTRQLGVSRRKGREAAQEVIEETRKLSRLRMKVDP